MYLLKTQNQKIKYSIIICAHNEEKKLASCVKSIENNASERNDVEIIIIDDNSADNTVLVAQSLKVDKIIEMPENQGISKCRNKGISAAKGEYVVFFDAHIYIDSSYSVFGLFDKIFKKYPDIHGISGCYKACDPTDYNSVRDIVRKHYRLKSKKSFIIDFENFTTLSSCALCLKKDIIAKEKFSENFKGVAAEDTFLQLSLMNKGCKFLHTNCLRVIHDASLTFKGLGRKIIYQCKGTNRLLKMLAKKRFKKVPFSPFYLDFPLLIFVLLYSLPLTILLIPSKILISLIIIAIVFDFHKIISVLTDNNIKLDLKIKTSIYILFNEGIKLIDWPRSLFREKYSFNDLIYVIRVYCNWEKIKLQKFISDFCELFSQKKTQKKCWEFEPCND